MPRGIRKTKGVELPNEMRFHYIDGKALIELQQAARLAGIHPAVLEMGHKLLADIGGKGAAFVLSTSPLQARAADIQAVMLTGLKRVVTIFGPPAVKVRTHRDAQRLVFWIERVKPRMKRAA